jgi:hypothetical protein
MNADVQSQTELKPAKILVVEDQFLIASSGCRRSGTRDRAYFMENKVVRSTDRCGRMYATATSVADSRVT